MLDNFTFCSNGSNDVLALDVRFRCSCLRLPSWLTSWSSGDFEIQRSLEPRNSAMQCSMCRWFFTDHDLASEKQDVPWFDVACENQGVRRTVLFCDSEVSILMILLFMNSISHLKYSARPDYRFCLVRVSKIRPWLSLVRSLRDYHP